MSEPVRTAVLVLESDPSFRGWLVEELARRGHRVLWAVSVADGRGSLRDDACDVVLLNLQLPGGSGLEALREIRSEPVTVEILVMADNADLPTARESLGLGAYDYLTKPLHLEDLEAKVLKAAEKCRLRREIAGLRARLGRHEPAEGPLARDQVQLPALRVPRTDLTLAQMEREYVEAVLEKHRGHRGRTAEALGIDPKTLYNKLRSWAGARADVGAARPQRLAGPQ